MESAKLTALEGYVEVHKEYSLQVVGRWGQWKSIEDVLRVDDGGHGTAQRSLVVAAIAAEFTVGKANW